MRGALTPKIQEIAKERIGREITRTELRLIPYIQYCLCNTQTLEPVRINEEERKILSDWKKEDWIEGGASANSLGASKPFWDFMCEILWEGYVMGGATE